MPNRNPALDHAVEIYEAGFSVSEVAAFYGKTRQGMWMILRRRGCKMRKQQRYGEDSHFYRGGQPSAERRVHHLTGKAIRLGILERPETCETCGKEPGEAIDGRALIQAHHDDYNKPLDVRWLCSQCHYDWHTKHVAVAMVETG